jgi:hypothetical protein
MNTERTFDPIKKALARPRSLRLAINAMCWDCIGAGADPNPRAAIRECSITRCPLHTLRPYQKVEDAKDEGVETETETETEVETETEGELA